MKIGIPLIAVTVINMAAMPLPAQAQANSGGIVETSSCVLEMQPPPGGETASWKMAFSVADNVSIYADHDGAATIPNTLKLFEIIWGREIKGSRIHIKIPGRDGGGDVFGWVERANLICREKPVRVHRHLEKKVYIKPDPEHVRLSSTNSPSARRTVHASPSPGVACRSSTGRGCVELKALHRFFVYGEAKNSEDKVTHYLLSSLPSLSPGSPILGWVPSGNAVEYSTNFGTNPDTVTADQPAYKDNVPFVCAFDDRGEAEAADKRWSAARSSNGTIAMSRPKTCIELVADSRWESRSDPMPILDRFTDDDVARTLRVAGVVDERGSLAEYSGNLDIAAAENVDVVFAIDATGSMKSSIKEISQKFVPTLTEKLKETNPALRFRFGWVVYRDKVIENPMGSPTSYALKDSDGLEDCSRNDLVKAQEALGKVETSVEVGTIRDDYPEDIEKGIMDGLAMLSQGSCSSNLKLLVVVGDAGGRPGPDNNDRKAMVKRVGAKMHDMNVAGKMRLSSIFVRTPEESQEKPEQQGFYNDAYRYFQEDWLSIFTMRNQNLEKTTGIRFSYNNREDQVKGVAKVEDIARDISAEIVILNNPDVIAALRRLLAAGMSLKDAYEVVRQQIPEASGLQFLDSYLPVCRAAVDADPQRMVEKDAHLNGKSGGERVKAETEFYNKQCSQSSIVRVKDMFVNYESPLFIREWVGNDEHIRSIDNDHKMKIMIRLKKDAVTQWRLDIGTLLEGLSRRGPTGDINSFIVERTRIIEKITGGEPKWDQLQDTALQFALKEGDFPVSYRSILLSYKNEPKDKSGPEKDWGRPGNLGNELERISSAEINRLTDWLKSSQGYLQDIEDNIRVSIEFAEYPTVSDVINQRLKWRPQPTSADRKMPFPNGRGYCSAKRVDFLNQKSEKSDSELCWIPVEVLP